MADPRELTIAGDTRSKSTLTIEEIAGRSGRKPRILVLTGGGLPFQGATWDSELVMKTTWYAGNAAEATQQILVPVDMPSQWEGMWRRTILAVSPAVYTDETGEVSSVVEPHVLREIVENIHRLGSKIRVTWAVSGTVIVGDPKKGIARPEDIRIVRVGRIKAFGTPIEKHTDIRWHATFEWSGRGTEQQRVANVDGRNDAEAAANALDAALVAAVNEAYNRTWVNKNFDVRKSATRITLGQLEAFADAPRQAVETYTRKLTTVVNDFRRIAEFQRQVAGAPVAIANTAIDFARNALFIVNDFTAQTGRTPAEQMTLKNGVRDLLRAWNQTQRIAESALFQAGAAIDLAGAMRKTRFPVGLTGALSVRESDGTRAKDVIAVHVCRVGDTPVSLSKRYYQNPDRGVDILRANRLEWHLSVFVPGKVLIIPLLSATTGM